MDSWSNTPSNVYSFSTVRIAAEPPARTRSTASPSWSLTRHLPVSVFMSTQCWSPSSRATPGRTRANTFTLPVAAIACGAYGVEYERFGVVSRFHVTRALTFFGIGADPRPGSVGAVGDFARTERTNAGRSRASNSLDRTSALPQRASSVPDEGSGTASSSETKPPRCCHEIC